MPKSRAHTAKTTPEPEEFNDDIHRAIDAPLLVKEQKKCFQEHSTILFPYGCPTADVKSQKGKEQEDH